MWPIPLDMSEGQERSQEEVLVSGDVMLCSNAREAVGSVELT